MVEHAFLESLPAYAAGALSGPELQDLEAHLRQGCELCEPELLFLSDAASRIPAGLPDYPLPIGLRHPLRRRIQQEFPTPVSVRARTTGAWWFAAAAALLLLLAAPLYWRQQIAVSRLESLAGEQTEYIGKLRGSLQKQQREIRWLRDPAVQLALLSGLELAPGASARMIWSPAQQKGILYVQSLPALPSEKSYQLWVIGDKGPVSAGLVEPDASGAAVLRISRIAGQAHGSLQFAVTIEPHGGVPQPTGSMVLAGKPL